MSKRGESNLQIKTAASETDMCFCTKWTRYSTCSWSVFYLLENPLYESWWRSAWQRIIAFKVATECRRSVTKNRKVWQFFPILSTHTFVGVKFWWLIGVVVSRILTRSGPLFVKNYESGKWDWYFASCVRRSQCYKSN